MQMRLRDSDTLVRRERGYIFQALDFSIVTWTQDVFHKTFIPSHQASECFKVSLP
jgi:hypothetical protein